MTDNLLVAFMERIMERISALEERQNKLLQAIEETNSKLEYVVGKSTSCFFSVSMYLKDTPQPGIFTFAAQPPTFGAPQVGFGFGSSAPAPHQNVPTNRRKLDTITTLIKEAFPQCKVYIDTFPTSSQKGTLYLELENGVMVDTVMNKLDMQLLQHVRYDKWHKLTDDNMKNVFRSKNLHQL